MTLDAKLRWKAQVKKKREDLGLRYRENVLAHGKKIGPVDTQRADAVQTNIDQRHTAVAVHETEQR
jgi:hypothetical protein